MRLLALFTLTVFLLASQDGASTFSDLATHASAARNANDLPKAMELYRQALSVDSSWQEGWWYLGSLSYDTDQFENGRDALQHFVDLNAGAAPGWALLGLCEFETGKYSPSLEHIEHALSLGVGNDQMTSVLRFHEALLLTRNENFDTALQKYAAFINTTATNPEVLLGIGLAATRQAKLPSKVPASDEELLTEIGKAVFYTMANRQSDAEQAYAELLRRFGNAPRVHYVYGVFLLANDPAKAVAEFKRELQISPDSAPASAMLAWLYLQQDDPASALPFSETAALHDPKSALSQLVLGRSLAETGDLKRGIEHLEQAVTLDASNLETHLALATAYSKAGRKQETLNERRVSLKMASEAAALEQR